MIQSIPNTNQSLFILSKIRKLYARKILVLGKAGSGKTHLVLQKYSRIVEEHKEDNVIFILPTYSQVEHLRDHILRTSGLRGILAMEKIPFILFI